MTPRRLAVALAFATIGGLVGAARTASTQSRPAWTAVTPSAAWSTGYSFAAIALRDTLWIFGHREGNWFSADGRTWTRTTSNVDFTAGYNTFVVLNDTVVAIGGTTDRAKLGPKGVWKSHDGRTWTLATDHPAWSARVWQATIVREGRIWLMGGWDGADRNDVWSSADGAEWTQATANAAWPARSMHSAAVFNGRLWVLAGRANMDAWWETDFHDVWSSADGVQWTRATGSPEWSKRYGAGAVAWDGKLWLMGGSRFFRSNDVWSSTDGKVWTNFGVADWSKRFGQATIVFRDAIWVLGGKEGGGIFTNDVWRLSRPAN